MITGLQGVVLSNIGNWKRSDQTAYPRITGLDHTAMLTRRLTEHTLLIVQLFTEWLLCLLCIWKVLSRNFGPQTNCLCETFVTFWYGLTAQTG